MAGRSLNKVMLIGNLTKDPTMRFTPTGAAVCSFSLATNSTWTPKDGGEKQEKAEYHNIVAWNKLAEIAGQYLKSGDKAYIEGRLQTRDWTDKEGQKRKSTEIVMENMLMLSPKGASGSYKGKSSDDSAMQSAPAGAMEDVSASDDVSGVEDISEDIPF